MESTGRGKRMLRQTPGGLAAILWAILALTMLLQRPAWAATRDLRVAHVPIANCIQLYVAMEKGFLAQEGINVIAKALPGGATMAPAMEAGELDVGFSNSFTIILGRDRGFDYQFLVNGAVNVEPTNSTNSLLVRADSPIKQLKDLEGKRVALNVLASINELGLKVAAEQAGLDLRKVTLQEIPFPNMEPALKNNNTDAVVASEPFVTLALGRGTARHLLKDFYSVFGPRVLIGSWFAKKAWIEKSPELAQGFVRAMHKATEYLNGHPDERPAILARYTRITPDVAKRIAWAAFSTDFPKSDLQPLIENAKKFGYIKASFDAGEIVSKYLTVR